MIAGWVSRTHSSSKRHQVWIGETSATYHSLDCSSELEFTSVPERAPTTKRKEEGGGRNSDTFPVVKKKQQWERERARGREGLERMAALGLVWQAAGLPCQRIQMERVRPGSYMATEFYGSQICNLGRVDLSISGGKQRRRCVAMVAPTTQEVAENSAEAALVEALIGVQGRGRAASKQQLQVCLENYPLYLRLKEWSDLIPTFNELVKNLSFFLSPSLSLCRRKTLIQMNRSFNWLYWYHICARCSLIVMLRLAQEVAEAVRALEDAGGIPVPVSMLDLHSPSPLPLPSMELQRNKNLEIESVLNKWQLTSTSQALSSNGTSLSQTAASG